MQHARVQRDSVTASNNEDVYTHRLIGFVLTCRAKRLVRTDKAGSDKLVKSHRGGRKLGHNGLGDYAERL